MVATGLLEKRAIEFTPTQLAEAVTECFKGYIQTFILDAEGFERRFRPEGLDTEASIILMDGDSPAAICLIARQGWTCRVAAMAIAPDFRGQGVGKSLMRKVIDEARDRGDHRIVLEVIEQNPPAIGLYESVGLKITRRLVGYRRSPMPSVAADLKEIDPLTVVRHMFTECDANLPWDFKPETLIGKSPPTLGLTIDERSFALVTNTPGERVIIWSLFTDRAYRNAGCARQLLEAIAARFTGKALVTPVALPDDLAPEFFASTGFQVNEISQYEMALDLV